MRRTGKYTGIVPCAVAAIASFCPPFPYVSGGGPAFQEALAVATNALFKPDFAAIARRNLFENRDS